MAAGESDKVELIDIGQQLSKTRSKLLPGKLLHVCNRTPGIRQFTTLPECYDMFQQLGKWRIFI